MVHVGMRDEDVAHPQKLAGRQPRDVADVKQDRPPLELQVDEYPRVAERPVDQRRVENGPHLAENTIRGPSEFARQPRPPRGARVEARIRLRAAETNRHFNRCGVRYREVLLRDRMTTSGREEPDCPLRTGHLARLLANRLRTSVERSKPSRR